MAPPPAWGVLFDIDGTLVDNVYLHTLAWARAFHDAGEQPSMARIHRHIGMGSDQLVSGVLGRSRSEISDGHSRHLAELEGDMRAFPRAADLLGAVAGLGGRVVLSTSAKPGEVDARLELIGGGDAVAHVTHSGHTEASKPEPDIFQASLEAAELVPERAVAVGDSVWDVEAASRCGLACVGVLSGGFSTAELLDAGAVAVYDDAAHLLARLDASPVGELARAHA